MAWIWFLDLYICLWPGPMALDGLKRVSGFINLSRTWIHGSWWPERVSRFINLSRTWIHGPWWPEAGFWIYKFVSDLDPWSLMAWSGLLDLQMCLWPGSMVLDDLKRVSGFINVSLTWIHGPWWPEAGLSGTFWRSRFSFLPQPLS